MLKNLGSELQHSNSDGLHGNPMEKIHFNYI